MKPVALLLLVAGCTVSAPGRWRSESQVVDVPAGKLVVVVREDGTGTLEIPAGFWWPYRDFLWTRDGDILELQAKDRSKPAKFRLEFHGADRVTVYVLPDEPPLVAPLKFRREKP